MKLSAAVLSQPLADTISNSISKGVFPDNAKVASVFPVHKILNDENKVSILRPVSVLNMNLLRKVSFIHLIVCYYHVTYEFQSESTL